MLQTCIRLQTVLVYKLKYKYTYKYAPNMAAWFYAQFNDVTAPHAYMIDSYMELQ